MSDALKELAAYAGGLAVAYTVTKLVSNYTYNREVEAEAAAVAKGNK